MNEPWRPSWEATAVYRARVRGCLLGGAVGDALGYPVEFSALDAPKSQPSRPKKKKRKIVIHTRAPS